MRIIGGFVVLSVTSMVCGMHHGPKLIRDYGSNAFLRGYIEHPGEQEAERRMLVQNLTECLRVDSGFRDIQLPDTFDVAGLAYNLQHVSEEVGMQKQVDYAVAVYNEGVPQKSRQMQTVKIETKKEKITDEQKQSLIELVLRVCPSIIAEVTPMKVKEEMMFAKTTWGW